MKLLFLGDFLYNYEYYQDDISSIINWINENDYRVILNLEGPLNDSGKPIKKRGKLLRQSKITINILKKMNVVGVCLANNHILDYGVESLSDTFKILSENNIQYTGAGMNFQQAIRPMIIRDNNDEVIIQNYGWDIEETVYATKITPGCAPKDEKLICDITKKLRSNHPNSRIVNVLHWGFELNYLPMPLDVMLAHKIIESGCDLIIGHHPHNIQPYEIYKNKHIFYSLGNFYFSSMRDNFHNKKFKNQVENLCDFGALVIYDSDSNYINIEHTVFYDYEIKESRIIDTPTSILMDYSGCDFFCKDYVLKAKQNSININPILTLDFKSNKRKLFKLKSVYLINIFVRFARKNKVIDSIYTKLRTKLTP